MPRKQPIDLILIPPVINPVTETESAYFTPVGMQALLGNLRQAGFTADIYAPHILIASDNDYRQIAEDILACQPLAAGFSTWCDSYPYSVLIAREIKMLNGSVPVIFGGPQASVLARKSLASFPFIDFVLQGEADRTLPALLGTLLRNESKGGDNAESLDAEDLNEIPGIVYRNSRNEIMAGPSTDLIEDLDELPVPAYEIRASQRGMVRIDAGRGCPFQCTYCSTKQFFSRKYRVKSPERLLQEFRYCEDKLGKTWMGISHDMFTLRHDIVKAFADRLIRLNRERKTPFSWTCSARTDCVSGSLLDRMYESGCRAVFFGMETASPRLQKQIRKNLDLDRASAMIRHSAKLGMFTVVSYMMGFPGETRQDLNRTLRSMLMESAHGAHTQLTQLSLLPGTAVYREHVKELVYDEHHSGFSTIYPTPAVTDMILADPEMFSSFYHLPSRHISRETYLFIAELAGYLEHFIPTLSMIRDSLAGDVAGFDILVYIEACMPEYRSSDTMVLPGLYFISDKLKAYLESLAGKGLPSAAWDVFLLDMTRAFNISKYRRWQLLRAGTQETGIDKLETGVNKLEPGVNYRIVKRPYWSVFQSEHYIYDFISQPVKEWDRASFRKGRYHYLVVPVSHRLANVFKIPLKERPIYDLEEVSFLEDIVRQYRHNLPEDRILQIIRRMKRRDLIDVYEIPGSDTTSAVHDEPALQPARY